MQLVSAVISDLPYFWFVEPSFAERHHGNVVPGESLDETTHEVEYEVYVMLAFRLQVLQSLVPGDHGN
jgi:hypothetical protein